MSTLTRLRMSEEEYLAHYADEQPPWEFDDGHAWQKRTMTQEAHVAIAEELSAIFREYRRRHGGFAGQAPTTNLSAAARQYRVPDFAYWPPGRPLGSGIFLPPALAIEIASLGQSLAALREKCRFYLVHGIDEAWLIDPAARTVTVFDRARDGVALGEADTLTSPQLPGFALPLRDLFAALDELPA